MVKSIVLHTGYASQRWSCLLEDMQGTASRLYRGSAAAILASNIPGVFLELARVRPSFWSREERQFLLVTNERIKECRILIGANDYGNNLSVYWYLFTMFYPGDLTLFQQQEFESFVTVIDRCVRQAIAELLLSVGQDPSFLLPDPHGFLGIS